MKASRYSHKTNTTFSFLISIMTVVLMGVFMLCGPLTASAEQAQKQILFINSYGYDFETVPIVMKEVSSSLGGENAIHYLFMNEKYVDAPVADESLSTELADLTAKTHYDVVILGDDAAFDFAIQHRDDYFKNIPLVYEDINSMEKAQWYINDPLIAGVVEEFPVKQTIEVAKKLYPGAKRVVVITDNSVSGRGSAKQVLEEQKDFPDLDFQVFDCSTMDEQEIQKNIATYTDDTILVYTVFNVDKTGKRYTMSQGIKLVTDNAKIPVFKADEAGVGEGLLGGYVLSYESIGRATAGLVQDMLQGKKLSADERCQRGNSKYLFDVKVLERYKIPRKALPKDSTFLNDKPGLFETYGHVLLPAFIVAILLINAVLWYSRQQKAILLKRLEESGKAVRVEEAANRAKTEFLSRMSHDIRTPLNAIMGMNFLAKKAIHEPNVVLGYLKKIDISSNVLLTLIDDILDVAQIERKTMKLKLAAYDLNELFTNIATVFMVQCEEKQIHFSVKPSSCNWEIITDAGRINQIFSKLLSNAVKYTPTEGTISFAVHEKQKGDQLACVFTVADTGCGIDPEFQQKMFEPFTQDTSKEVNKVHGAGIGLMIVKNLVEMMGGIISMQSTPGEGTIFAVSLTFDICVVPEIAGLTEHTAPDSMKILQGKRMLVVEDNQLNAEIEKEVLENAGIQVELAENGQIALEKVKVASENYYDIIFMDIRMPVMGGMEATEAIRALDMPWCQNVPIIAVTADAFDDDVRRFLQSGMNDCLTKPINPDDLFDTIIRYMKDKK